MDTAVVHVCDAIREIEYTAVVSHDDHRPFADPFFWGAFICQGDPSPLPAVSSATGSFTQSQAGGQQ